MGPTFTYASLPPALQNAAAAAAAAASASQAATGLPLSHYAQSQLQEARMQWPTVLMSLSPPPCSPLRSSRPLIPLYLFLSPYTAHRWPLRWLLLANVYSLFECRAKSALCQLLHKISRNHPLCCWSVVVINLMTSNKRGKLFFSKFYRILDSIFFSMLREPSSVFFIFYFLFFKASPFC